MFKNLMVIIVATFITLATAPLEAAVEGEGKIKEFAFSVSDDSALVRTFSTVFVPVPDMLVDKFVSEGPVLIRFCGAIRIVGGGAAFLKAQVDGLDVLPPGVPGAIATNGIQFSITSASLPHCFTWIATDLEIGTHTFEILWTTTLAAGEAILQSRILIVESR